MSTETSEQPSEDLVQLTSQIVTAYAGNNQLGRDELAGIIRSVHGTLTELKDGTSPAAAPEEDASAPLVPAVPIDQSVTDDAIICLEDGKSFKTLKRHLRTAYNMSPEEYREKWGLSKSYPMVAPAYSAKRAATAKAIGLGRKPEPKPETAEKPKPKPRARKAPAKKSS